MKDALGQELHPGQHVVWGGGTGQYSGLPLHTVEKITNVQVTIKPVTKSPHDWRNKPRSVKPNTVLVVDAILERQEYAPR
jgi:hypothetical protein